MKNLVLLTTLTLLMSFSSQAKVTIKGLDFKKTAHRGTVSIQYDGQMRSQPEMSVVGKTIQVIIPNSEVSNTIERSVSFSSKLRDTSLKAYQTTKSDSKIKITLPFNAQAKKDYVNLTFRDNKIDLSFPRVAVKMAKAPKYRKITQPKKETVKKENLDENYLNQLLKVEKPAEKAVDAKTAQDKVNTKLAATNGPRLLGQSKKGDFSLIEYGGKFVAFLGVVLLLFYGVITLMKKGVIKKGKLGFLNNTDQITVVSQTYIAPKKSLMLIKAHNQVFLVSNTDQGIHPISEIKDAAGLFKAGEKALSGHNFDSKLTLADEDETIDSKIKLKEDITQSNAKAALSSYEPIKDKVKFSDQIKKKVKDLKPLQ
ncbi:MAG: hypothetical protein CME62_13205 [Halobacteriovoraceae bacterium]|nr:hypothetical protein [Halobacteriovoraceae bacterium]